MNRYLSFSVSSRTGNTRKVAEGVRAQAEAMGWGIHEIVKGEDPVDDVVIMCFWCFKSTFDPLSLKRLASCQGKRILAIGTFGGYPQSNYGDKVRRNVTAAIEQENECLGVFLCQGKVSMESVEKRRQLPVDDPHYLNDWGVARLVESQKHPDETDVVYAVAYTHDHLPA